MLKKLIAFNILRGSWIPLGTYSHAGVFYLVMARRGITGMLTFKVRRMTRYWTSAEGFQSPKLDIAQQWEKLTEEPKPNEEKNDVHEMPS